MQASTCIQEKYGNREKQIKHFFPSRASYLNPEFLYHLNEFAPYGEYRIFRPGPWDKEIVQKSEEILNLNVGNVAGETIVFLRREESGIECGRYDYKLRAAKLDTQSKCLHAHEAIFHPYFHNTNKTIANAVARLDRGAEYSPIPALRDLEEALATYTSGRIFDNTSFGARKLWDNKNQRYIYKRLLELDQKVGPKKTLEKMFLPEVVTIIDWM